MGEGPFPVISYHNGTNTLHNNAPSENPDSDLYVLLEAIASTGFVIALPDYIGFGSTADKFHPYLHEESTVPVVLDMLRAIEELATLREFTLSNDLYLTGYSMGGWATLQVQRAIETQYSDEFNLKASAPSAGPYDLYLINNHILNQETYCNPYFMGFVYESYKNLEIINTPLEEVFNSPYDSLVAILYDGTLSGEEINNQLTTDIPDLFTENFLLNYDSDTTFSSIGEALEANSIEPWSVSTPTRLIHGTVDELVPFQVTQTIHQELINAGTSPSTVQVIPLPGIGHNDGIIPAGLFSIEWFFEISEE
jgi:pimeloyl-ACP methyl ester carboxylesterase